MAFTPQGTGQWNVLEWDHTMFALTPGNYANVFLGSSTPSPGMVLAYIEIDLTSPVGPFPWGADMADPWTAEIGFYLINPPNYPSSYQDACIDNPKPFVGFALQADGHAHCVSVARQGMAWMGDPGWIQTVGAMAGHLADIGTGVIGGPTGSSIYTLQLANYESYGNSYINMKNQAGVCRYQAHAIRALTGFSDMFPTPGTNLVLWLCLPTGAAINLDHIYVGNGCFPQWRPPIVQVPENIGYALRPDKNLVMRDGSASYDLYGAKLQYDWEMINAPDASGVVEIVTDAHTDIIADPFTDTVKKTGIGVLASAGDWMVYKGSCYTITGWAMDSLTIGSSVFPTGATGIRLKIIKQSPMTWATWNRAMTAVPVDVAGSYILRLRAHNGVHYSPAAETAIMVREPHTKPGVGISADFIWSYLSDVWGSVEEKEFATEYFSALLQQGSSLLMQAWQAEADGRLLTAQPFQNYRWMVVNRLVEEEGAPELVSGLACVTGRWSGAIAGATLSLRLYTGSGGYEDVTLTLTAATALEEATAISAALETYAVSASTMVYPATLGTTWIFIKGPIGIEVTGGSLAGVQFTNGDKNLLEHAGLMIGGVLPKPLGRHKYRLNKPAYGLSLNRHFLVLRGEAYEISRIEHGPAMPFTDLTLIQELPDLDDSELATWAIPGYYKSDTDYYGKLVFSGDVMTLLRIDASSVVTTEDVTVAGCLEHGTGTMSFTPYNPYYAVVALLKVMRTFYQDLDDRVFSIPLVQSKIVPSIVADYFYQGEEYAVGSYRGAHCLDHTYAGSPAYVSSAYEPLATVSNFTERAVAEQVIVDNSEIIYRNFGYLVGLEYDQSVTPDVLHYLDAVRGLWKIYAEGRTIENLRRGINMFFSLSVCQRSGTIREVLFYGNSDYGHMLVEDGDNASVLRTYVLDRKAGLAANPRTGRTWAIGDGIYRFERISGGADVQDIVSDPNFFQPYVGGSFGTLPEEMNRLTAYHRFLVRASGYSVTGNRYDRFLQFVNSWRPRYTQFIFALLATPFDDLVIQDAVSFNVTLHLKDTFCPLWDALLHPWSGVADACDHGGRFMTTDDLGPSGPPPPWPTSSFKADFGRYCPKNIITAYLSYSFVPPMPMMYDTIFFWDGPPGPDWDHGDGAHITTYTGTLTATIPLET